MESEDEESVEMGSSEDVNGDEFTKEDQGNKVQLRFQAM